MSNAVATMTKTATMNTVMNVMTTSTAAIRRITAMADAMIRVIAKSPIMLAAAWKADMKTVATNVVIGPMAPVMTEAGANIGAMTAIIVGIPAGAMTTAMTGNQTGTDTATIIAKAAIMARNMAVAMAVMIGSVSA